MTTINSVGNGLSGTSGTGNFVGSTSPILVTPTIGVAAATSVNFGGSPLSAYVEGTVYVPTVSFATNGNLSVSYNTQDGFYTRVGNLVTVTFAVIFSPTYTTASGNFQVSLPIASSANAKGYAYGTVFTSSITFPTGTTAPFLYVPSGSNTMRVQSQGSAVAAATWTTTQIVSGVPNYNVYGTVTYFV